jgi:hypothetical protein
MTNEEKLMFCKKCLNRKMDLKKGLVCNLTNEKPIFEKECPDFRLDEKVIEVPLNDKDGLQPEEIAQRLPPEILERLRLDQNLPLGLIAGVSVGIIGAILWGAITVATEFQIGYMALAIGAGVGISVRIFGKGIDKIFGILGATIALLSCLLGNFFSIIGFIANTVNLGYFETLSSFNYSYLPDIMAETFSIIDLLFYGIALYEGYKFSFRIITEKEIQNLTSKN